MKHLSMNNTHNITGGIESLTMYDWTLETVNLPINPSTISDMQQKPDLYSEELGEECALKYLPNKPIFLFYILIDEKNGTYQIYRDTIINE